MKRHIPEVRIELPDNSRSLDYTQACHLFYRGFVELSFEDAEPQTDPETGASIPRMRVIVRSILPSAEAAEAVSYTVKAGDTITSEQRLDLQLPTICVGNTIEGGSDDGAQYRGIM